MTERPILFSGAMVTAILAGTKTQTRRVVMPQPEHRGDIGGEPALYWRSERRLADIGHEAGYIHTNASAAYRIMGRCSPYGNADDRLWVRETFAVDAPLEEVRAEREDAMQPEFGHGPYYRADQVHENTGLTWRPAIHMPRWACRLVLDVTSVCVERLQSISEQDALEEGFEPIGHATTPIDWYAGLWDSLNEKRGYGWTINPWVWVIEFRRSSATFDERKS